MSIIMKVFQENEIALKRFTSASYNVDDFAQEIFLKGFAAELRTQINEPKAFLFKIAKNVALTEVRKDARSPRGYLKDVDDISQILDENQATAEDWLDGRKKLILFSKAVAQLTACLLITDFGGQCYPAVFLSP
jgi:DNA-directed RNA polymerase specialized sigma24 family protein